jgi:predicted ATPase
VYQLRGEAAVVAVQANAAIALGEEHDFAHYRAVALILRGWASAQQGEFEKGISEIQEGLEKERTTGGLLFESNALGLLADACITNERYGQTFDFLDQAQSRLNEEPNAFTRPKYIACSGTHICDLDEIWIRRSAMFVKALRLRVNRKPNRRNSGFA